MCGFSVIQVIIIQGSWLIFDDQKKEIFNTIELLTQLFKYINGPLTEGNRLNTAGLLTH